MSDDDGMTLEDRIGEIADKPLQHLERYFSELSAGMGVAGDQAEAQAAGAFLGEEKFAQIILMSHSRGIAAAMEIAATEVGKARAALAEAVAEMKDES